MAEQAAVNVGDVWFRFAEISIGHFDYEFEYVVGSHLELRAQTYYVSKVTPKGVWLGFWPNTQDRFVRLNARKRWAHPTKEEALESFLARKARQRSLLENQLKRCKQGAELAKQQLEQLRKATAVSTAA